MTGRLYYSDSGAEIYQGDARTLPLPDESVHLIITSPPYNSGIRYDSYHDRLPWDQYWDGLVVPSLKECFRVLVPGGRLCFNFANVNQQEVKAKGTWPVLADIEVWPAIKAAGFLPRERITWIKGDEADLVADSTAWGSWRSASCPVVRAIAEPIYVASKVSHKRLPGPSDLTADEFKLYTRNVWPIPQDGGGRFKKLGKHPATFPLELARRLIKLYCYVGETVLDPFVGSGTVLAAAHIAHRFGVGVDVSSKYCEMAKTRYRQTYL